MKFVRILPLVVLLITITSFKQTDPHKYTGIDLTKRPLPFDIYTKYLYYYDSLFIVSDASPTSDQLFVDRIDRKIGTVKNVDTKLINEGDVAVTNPETSEIRKGDGIYKISDIEAKFAVLIKGKDGYHLARYLTDDPIR